MTHDERVYPEPFAFKPERFFDNNGDLNDDDRILAYGFGRRYIAYFLCHCQVTSQRTTEVVLESMSQAQPSVLLYAYVLK